MSTPEQPSGIQVQRTFDETSSDFVAFYSDFAQILCTNEEVRLQFYETIPGPPGEDGVVASATSRLRASVTVSLAHAQRIGQRLSGDQGAVTTDE